MSTSTFGDVVQDTAVENGKDCKRDVSEILFIVFTGSLPVDT
jgi:hypothetical protein